MSPASSIYLPPLQQVSCFFPGDDRDPAPIPRFLPPLSYREFLESNGIPRTAMLEVDMPNFLNTERNTGSCWLVMDDVSQRVHPRSGAIFSSLPPPQASVRLVGFPAFLRFVTKHRRVWWSLRRENACLYHTPRWKLSFCGRIRVGVVARNPKILSVCERICSLAALPVVPTCTALIFRRRNPYTSMSFGEHLGVPPRSPRRRPRTARLCPSLGINTRVFPITSRELWCCSCSCSCSCNCSCPPVCRPRCTRLCNPAVSCVRNS